MAIAPGVATSTDSNPTEEQGAAIDAPGLNYFVFALFFIFGGITSLNDVILPKLKELFTLNYTQAMLIQFCFFTAYLVIGIPGAQLVKRIGYMRGAVVGLLTMMTGCLLFIPASQTATYGLFLFALFVLAVIAAVVWSFRNRLQGEKHEQSSLTGGFQLLRRPRFGYGALCIFLYVGAEVSIGSLIVSYLMQNHVMGLGEQAAGNMIPLYWGGALVGRIIGSLVLRYTSPGLVLASVAAGAIALLAISTHTTGTTSGYSLLAIGLMNSIMFPTIFSLACEKLGAKAADGSGIINIAIFGGAVVPLLTGMLADATGGNLALAMIIPAVCYAIIAGFGIFARKPA
ncbi:MAG: glucose/galactose MFS transporter [Sphingomonadales bacterium]|nr:glucose/galactose MFS transporter [Sphingomonadales bacterium]